MSAQIVEICGTLFNALLTNQHSIRAALWEAGFGTPKLWRDAPPHCILIEADIARYELGHRPILQDSVVAMAIVQTGNAPSIWPRPLPDAVTQRLLDSLEPILCSIEGLSAHEHMELAAAFNCARQAPAITAETLTLVPAETKRQRKLRMHGLRLTQALGAELAQLDVRVSRYAENVRLADVEECIAALSSCSELGIRLRLRPGNANEDSTAGLLTISRRPSLEALMETVACLSDATLQSFAAHAPHSSWQDTAMTMERLAHIQAIATNSAHRQARNPWRSYDAASPSSSCADFDSPVPSSAVLKGITRWIQESDRRRWVGVHPLVTAAILHTEFARLRPFEVGNKRVGRILFQSHLYAAGWPALPWAFAFEMRYDDYVAALEESLRKRSYDHILKFVIECCKIAVAQGEIMVPAMQLERENLATVLSGDPDICVEDAQLYAESLLSGLFLEGFGFLRGLQTKRPVLQRLHAAGVIDRIRTPIGAVYSLRCCRELMKSKGDCFSIV